MLAGLAAAPPAAQSRRPAPDLEDTLLRVGSRIEEWYARAQRIISRETVWIQPLRADLMPGDVPRRLAFDLRVAWEPERTGPRGIPEASVLREMLSINGRPARESTDPGCVDPKPVSPEPLGLLLPARQRDSEFSLAGTSRVDGRTAVMVDFRGRSTLPAEIQWTEQCVSVSVPGRSRGRIWIDAERYDVLRFDDRLIGQFEFDVPREFVRRGAAASMVIERAESSIRYKRVEFHDPPETLFLPASIDTVTVIRGRITQRTRITQRFTDHRRFLTDGRILN